MSKYVLGVAITVVLSILAGTPVVSQQTMSRGEEVRYLEIIGILKNADGAEVVGETLYFIPVVNGRIEMTYGYEGGQTTGIKNPSAATDKAGRFRIKVGLALVKDGQEFTIGVLRPFRTKADTIRTKEGLPKTFRIEPISRKDPGTTKIINVGEITLR